MPVEQLIENCLNNNSNSNRRPLIIDTDADVDDLWAIHYLVNVPTIDVLAITTVGNAFSGPFYSASNILRLLDLIGCKNHIPVAYGLSLPLLSPGWKLPDTMLNGINTYLTAPTCLNQSAANIFIQPSPFEAVELIKLTLKYSIKPVDILVLGTMTNIAAAITEDRSIIPKIGTLYFSGGQFKSVADYSSLIPSLQSMTFPYSSKTSQSSSNVFLDVLAMQRVGESGIENFVAMPSLTERQLPVNLTQLDMKLSQMNINLSPFLYKYLTSFAKCAQQNESDIYWWDNSAAAFMVELQNNKSDICKEIKTVKSIYILAADALDLFGQGMTDIESADPSIEGLPTYKICTQVDSDRFLTEFLTKINSNQLPACKNSFSQRFDMRLQRCLRAHALDYELNQALFLRHTTFKTLCSLLILTYMRIFYR